MMFDTQTHVALHAASGAGIRFYLDKPAFEQCLRATSSRPREGFTMPAPENHLVVTLTTAKGVRKRGQRRGRQLYGSLFSRTMRFSLRRALSLDSVDGGTHNPKVGGSNPPPATKLIDSQWLADSTRQAVLAFGKDLGKKSLFLPLSPANRCRIVHRVSPQLRAHLA
jgi:hypothetical protein